MTKEIKAAIAVLNESNKVAQIIAQRASTTGESDLTRAADDHRIRLLADLRTVHEHVSQRAVKVDELPRWLKDSLQTLCRLVDSAPTGDLEKINSAMRSVLDQRPVLLGILQAAAVDRIGPRLQSGLTAVSEAEQAAKRSSTAAGKAEGSQSAAQKSAEIANADAGSAEAAKQKAEESQRKAGKSAEAAAKEAETAGKYRGEAKGHRDSAQTAANHALAMQKASEKIKADLDTLAKTEQEEVETHQAFRGKLEKDLKEISERARHILFDATTAALAEQWAAKRRNAQWIAVVWCVVLFVFVAVALLSSVFIVAPEAFSGILPEDYLARIAKGDGSFEHSILTKIFIVPPVIFGIWFSASQYAHTRDRQLEFGKREALAKTLEAYHVYLKGLAPEDEAWQKEVLALFKRSIEQLYEFLLAPPESTPKSTFRLLRKQEYTLEDIVEIVTRAKSLGVNIENPRP